MANSSAHTFQKTIATSFYQTKIWPWRRLSIWIQYKGGSKYKGKGPITNPKKSIHDIWYISWHALSSRHTWVKYSPKAEIIMYVPCYSNILSNPYEMKPTGLVSSMEGRCKFWGWPSNNTHFWGLRIRAWIPTILINPNRRPIVLIHK